MSIRAFCTIDEKCWDDRDVPAWSIDLASDCIQVETRQAGPFRLNSLSFFNLCGQVGYSRLIPTGGPLCLSRSLKHALTINL